MPNTETETRIFCRLAAREPIIEVARLVRDGSCFQIAETVRSLPERSEIVLAPGPIAPERILQRSGRRRLRCDAGRVRQDFAAIQAHACEAGVMFI